MGSLQRFEQRLEHMVTGAFARTFRSAVQPVEIAAALRREVDNSAQILSRDRRLAPNDFTIDLSPADFDRLSGFGETLSQELADMLHQHAADENYVFVGPVRLNFQRVDDLTTGRFRVRSQATAAVSQTPAPNRPASPSPRPAPVILEINGGQHPIEPPGVVVGRGSGADLRIDDPSVSRRHAEFRVRATSGGLQVAVVDLGSTNGTVVNGQDVGSAAVSDGATVQLGSTSIVVRIPSSPPQAGSGWSSPSGYGQPPAGSR
jgi:FhaA, N-terminal domain/FHA domain